MRLQDVPESVALLPTVDPETAVIAAAVVLRIKEGQRIPQVPSPGKGRRMRSHKDFLSCRLSFFQVSFEPLYSLIGK